VLVGGEGDDTLTGDDGRDLMIGGLGADTITGSKDEDILIAGWTSFDDNLAALSAIMAEWGSTAITNANRVAHLSGTAGGLNGSTFLRGSDVSGGVGNQTVFDDNAVDRLTGSQGFDWFMANTALDNSTVKDIITDLASRETSSDIDLNML
jgi:Ca2+-binding RTX toxin-like protein